MTKRTGASAKRLSAANLEAMGGPALAALLIELAESQPALKRRLRMELAAEVGAADLAVEIDKRLATVAGSKAKVSWRKRPEFILDLDVLRRMTSRRLGALDPGLAIPRLWAFLDLSDGLAGRVKDPKGELEPVFADAAADLGTLAAQAPNARTDMVELVADILVRGGAAWGERLQAALPAFGQPFSAALLAELRRRWAARPAVKPSPRMIRAIADAAGDADAFIDTIPTNLRQDPTTAAAIAGRLIASGRVDEAVAVLKASDPRNRQRPFGARRDVGIEAWQDAWIEALERSGQTEAAQAERWEAFERTLAPDHLRAFLKRLADFDDVVATDKAMETAARHTPFAEGLAFLMEWPSPHEAARMVLDRRDEIAADVESLAEWASRLEGRYPSAALLLVRAALTTVWRDPRLRDHAENLMHEAESLAARLGDARELESHEAFLDRLTARRGR